MTRTERDHSTGTAGGSAGTAGGGSRATVMAVISAIARFGLAAVWLYSGAVKLANPLDSHMAVAAYQILPESMVSPVATALPALELILGLMLLLGVFLRPAAAVSAVIMLGFIAGIISAWARGLQIDCGCFGGGGTNPDANAFTYLQSIARDGLFLLFAGWTMWRPFTRLAIKP